MLLQTEAHTLGLLPFIHLSQSLMDSCKLSLTLISVCKVSGVHSGGDQPQQDGKRHGGVSQRGHGQIHAGKVSPEPKRDIRRVQRLIIANVCFSAQNERDESLSHRE